eukprot:263925-Chlamydomonas_euryale.AAC.1
MQKDKAAHRAMQERMDPLELTDTSLAKLKQGGCAVRCGDPKRGQRGSQARMDPLELTDTDLSLSAKFPSPAYDPTSPVGAATLPLLWGRRPELFCGGGDPSSLVGAATRALLWGRRPELSLGGGDPSSPWGAATRALLGRRRHELSLGGGDLSSPWGAATRAPVLARAPAQAKCPHPRFS